MIHNPLDTAAEGSAPVTDDKANARRNRDLVAALDRKSSLMSHAAGASGYVPSDSLVTAINVTIAAQAPLLVMGEPGTGKTQAGYYAAKAFALPEPIVFPVRSVSTVRDLLYEFDAVAYLRAAYETKEHGGKLSRAAFVRPGPLWRALASADPLVLIIDEIDKAPKDFPNDLLHVLDQFWFDVPELDGVPPDEVQARFASEVTVNSLYRPDNGPTWRVKSPNERRPLVFITSNDERRLPEAFLRRCVFHHIVLTRGLVAAAVTSRRTEFALGDDTVSAATAALIAIRKIAGQRKKPSLSELLVWLRVLAVAQVGASAILEASPAEVPLVGALVKDARDLAALAAEGRTIAELTARPGAARDVDPV